MNNRDKNFRSAKIEPRRKQLEESVSRYLSQLDTADLRDPSETLTLKKERIKEKAAKLKSQMAKLDAIFFRFRLQPDAAPRIVSAPGPARGAKVRARHALTAA